jgi:hypothetical protein
MPALISPDGRWWWDGQLWRSRLVEGRLDAFWFTTTPDWFSRVAVTGLIGLIPIVGAINLFGWTLTATDMVRTGWKELPPPGFQYLQRGVNPFVVGFVYSVALLISFVALVFAIVLLATSGRTQAVVAAIVLGVVLFSLALATWMASLYVFAALLIASDRLGIGKALDPRHLFALARADHDVSLRVGLVYLASSLAFAAISAVVGLVIPFGGFIVAIGLPAVYAILVPSLAAFRVETAPGPPQT